MLLSLWCHRLYSRFHCDKLAGECKQKYCYVVFHMELISDVKTEFVSQPIINLLTPVFY